MVSRSDFPLIQGLTRALEAAESHLTRRANVIRFLVGRFLVMLLMVLAFWWMNTSPMNNVQLPVMP